jgi:hypothetical protein
VHTVYHLFALSNPALLSAALEKSISSACCPIFACSTSSSGSSSFLSAGKAPTYQLSEFPERLLCLSL